MIPKKAKEFIIPTAEITGNSEELVKAVIDFYWTELKKNLVGLNHLNIDVPGLGTFKLKSWKIEEVEKEKNGHLHHHKTKKKHITFQKFAIIKEVELKLVTLKRVQELIKQENIRKDLAKKRRHEYNEGLDKQKKDLGGDNQLPIQEGLHREDSKRET